MAVAGDAFAMSIFTAAHTAPAAGHAFVAMAAQLNTTDFVVIIIIQEFNIPGNFADHRQTNFYRIQAISHRRHQSGSNLGIERIAYKPDFFQKTIQELMVITSNNYNFTAIAHSFGKLAKFFITLTKFNGQAGSPIFNILDSGNQLAEIMVIDAVAIEKVMEN